MLTDDECLDSTLKNFLAASSSVGGSSCSRGAESYDDFIRSFQSHVSGHSPQNAEGPLSIINHLDSLPRKERLMALRETFQAIDAKVDPDGYESMHKRYVDELRSSSFVDAESLIAQAKEQDWMIETWVAQQKERNVSVLRAMRKGDDFQDDDNWREGSGTDDIEEADLSNNLTTTGGMFAMLQVCSSAEGPLAPKLDNFVDDEWGGIGDTYCPLFGLSAADRVTSFTLDPLFDYDSVKLTTRPHPSLNTT